MWSENSCRKHFRDRWRLNNLPATKGYQWNQARCIIPSILKLHIQARRTMQLADQDLADVVGALRMEKAGSAAKEKRRAVRVMVNARLNVGLMSGDAIEKQFSVLTRDVSVVGIGLFQSLASKPGQELLLALPRNSGKPPLIYVIRVMHCREVADGIYGVGCEFTREAPPAMGAKLSK
jgi:hypothetical protein